MRPLPIQLAPRVPATSGLIGAALLVAVLELLGHDITALTVDRSTFTGEPWRLWTSALPHVGVLHLAFNLYWTWRFGGRVEERYGSWRTLGLYALLAPVSTAAEHAIFRGGVGLSGVGYGLFGFLWIASKRDSKLSDAMDPGTVKLFVGWFFVCIAATVAGMLPVANVAHGAGCAMGVLLGSAAVGSRRPVAIAAILLLTVACGGGAWVARPYVNLSGEPALELATLGDAVLDEGDPARAIEAYRRSLELEPDDARVHYNLGVALQRAQRYEEALASYERSFELAPDADRRSAVRGLCEHLGHFALAEGRGPEALRLFGRVAALYPDDPEAQQALRDARTWVRAAGDAARE